MDPVAFTIKRYANRIISDAKSVRVKVSNAGETDLDPGEVVYVSPYLGVLNDVVEAGKENKPVALALGPIIVATTKLTAEQDFAAGTAVYWDADNDKFTETPTDLPAGWVYKTKGTESTPVAHVLLIGPQAEPVDLTDAATVVDGLKEAELTTLASIKKQNHIADVVDVAGEAVADLITDLNKTGGVVDTLNAILALLEASGLVKAS